MKIPLPSPKTHRPKRGRKTRPDSDLLESPAMTLHHQVGNRAIQQIHNSANPPAVMQQALTQGALGAQTLMRQKTEEPKPEDPTTLSGAHWHDEFPTSTELSDLDGTFAGRVQKFIAALEKAGATVEITATKRPAERAFLMHWAWMIAKKGFDPKSVPAMKGVDIHWWHGDQAKSKDAAQAMCDKYQLNKLKVPPALNSHHITGKAVDMKIKWEGDLLIKNAKGIEVLIKSSPRDHTNAAIIRMAQTYQVIHFKDVQKDKVHWSVDGS